MTLTIALPRRILPCMALGAILLLASVAHAQQSQIAFGALQTDVKNLPRNRAAGLRLVVLSLGWNRYEPRQGEFNDAYIEEMRQRLAIYRTSGMQIIIDFGMQYPPAWVFDLPHSRFVNQYGQAFRDASKPGINGANAVFCEAVRQRQAAYVARVFADFGTDFHSVRLGWGYYGELNYPWHRYEGSENCYWAYDDLAQGKAPGLPPTLSPCPVPGWVAGQASDGHHAASRFLDWYLRALQDYHDWQVRTVRAHYAGPVAMLYPSWGIRPGQIEAAVMGDLSGSTPAEKNGEIQRGYDFARFIGGVTDPKLIVYNTWIDPKPEFGDDASANPARWSPPHWLSYLAQRHPMKLQIMGENTGPGTVAALDLTLHRAQEYGFSGVLWAFEPNLYDGAEGHATIEQMGAAIAALRGK